MSFSWRILCLGNAGIFAKRSVTSVNGNATQVRQGASCVADSVSRLGMAVWIKKNESIKKALVDRIWFRFCDASAKSFAEFLGRSVRQKHCPGQDGGLLTG